MTGLGLRIPDAIPSVPGFKIESVYKPASEVGGDFFQIISTGIDGALIVIGDLSGKGMPAAMAVSLLVGTFRTLAHYTQSPSEILSAMNQRMLARSNGGFTTCLVLRADPDGVIEAQNAAGELFGFERTAAISTQSAEPIAHAAQAFGQEDDITVLTYRLPQWRWHYAHVRRSLPIFPACSVWSRQIRTFAAVSRYGLLLTRSVVLYPQMAIVCRSSGSTNWLSNTITMEIRNYAE
jgi:hypothetical protein